MQDEHIFAVGDDIGDIIAAAELDDCEPAGDALRVKNATGRQRISGLRIERFIQITMDGRIAPHFLREQDEFTRRDRMDRKQIPLLNDTLHEYAAHLSRDAMLLIDAEGCRIGREIKNLKIAERKALCGVGRDLLFKIGAYL